MRRIEIIGTRLKEIRKELGITQKQLADIIGITPQATAKKETLGRTTIREDRLLALIGKDRGFLDQLLVFDEDVDKINAILESGVAIALGLDTNWKERHNEELIALLKAKIITKVTSMVEEIVETTIDDVTVLSNDKFGALISTLTGDTVYRSVRYVKEIDSFVSSGNNIVLSFGVEKLLIEQLEMISFKDICAMYVFVLDINECIAPSLTSTQDSSLGNLFYNLPASPSMDTYIGLKLQECQKSEVEEEE